MKFLLFDDILETHVRRSLARGLEGRGHEVLLSPKIWKGHYPPTEAEDIAHINAALDAALQDSPDVLFNLRASTLTPDMLARVRAAGVLSMVWLHDDPVLYRVCYAGIVEHYDIVLNCGGSEILRFYEERHGIRGVNFPFWTDKIEFPRVRFGTTPADYDIAFLGNLKGAVRQRRYDMIADLPGRIRIYGKADRDPAGLVRGYLETEAEVANALAPAQLALNIPQIFSDYRGHKYDFDGMARLGSFEYPSRVIQYAALGLPVFTLGVARPPAGFPEMMAASTVAKATPMLRDLLAEPERLAALSDSTHARFDTSFSADARAVLLERLVTDPAPVLAATAEFRAEVFAGPDDALEARKAEPSLADARRAVVAAGIDADSKYRVLCCIPATRSDDMAGHLRALRTLGHAVTVVKWPAEVADIVRTARTFRTSVALFADFDRNPPADAVLALKSAGCHVVYVSAGDLPIGVDLAWLSEPAPDSEAARPADILLSSALAEQKTFESLDKKFALVERLSDTAPTEVLAGLDRGLIYVMHETARAGAVCQAVARGTIPTVPETTGLDGLFTPGEEIITFGDDEDLAEKLTLALADPAERERTRRRAFDRLAALHLLEQKWKLRLQGLPVRPIAREVRVLVTGYYGHENLGDELILDSLLEVAADKRPEITFCVATAAAETLRRTRGIETVGIGDVPALARLAPTLDAAILGGGGLWHDYSFRAAGGVRALYDGAERSIGGYVRPNLMAAACGAESHVYGMGVGPLSDPDAKKLLANVAQNMTSITVRDSDSRDILQSIPGWSQPVQVAPDMVYAVDIAARLSAAPEPLDMSWTEGLPVLVVNLRDWALGDLEQLTSRIVAALAGLMHDRPFALLGVPMQEKNDIDAKALDLLFSKVSAEVPRQILDPQGNSTKALQAIAAADIVLAMRLHTCLLGHRLGKPVVGCSYDPKVRAHFVELGRERFLFDFTTQPGQLERQLKRAADEAGELPHEMLTRVGALEKTARAAMEDFITSLPAARRDRPPYTEHPGHATDKAEKKSKRGRNRRTKDKLRRLIARIVTGRRKV